jgi:hypothetical protein
MRPILDRLADERWYARAVAAVCLLTAGALILATLAFSKSFRTENTVQKIVRPEVQRVIDRTVRLEQPSTMEVRRRLSRAIRSLTLGQRQELARSLLSSLPLSDLQQFRGPRGPRGFPGHAVGQRGPRGATCIEQLGLSKCRGPVGPRGERGAQGPKGDPGSAWISPSVDQIAQQVWDQICRIFPCRPKRHR